MNTLLQVGLVIAVIQSCKIVYCKEFERIICHFFFQTNGLQYNQTAAASNNLVTKKMNCYTVFFYYIS